MWVAKIRGTFLWGPFIRGSYYLGVDFEGSLVFVNPHISGLLSSDCSAKSRKLKLKSAMQLLADYLHAHEKQMKLPRKLRTRKAPSLFHKVEVLVLVSNPACPRQMSAGRIKPVKLDRCTIILQKKMWHAVPH